MKKFLNSNYWVKDSKGNRHYDEIDIVAVKFNNLRKKLVGRSYNRFEIVALLSKKLDYYLSFEILPVLVEYGLLVKPQRGIYQFNPNPVYKTKIYTCLAKIRVNRLT